MEIKTCEQKVLADLEQAENEIFQLSDENLRLQERVKELEKRLQDVFDQAHRLEVERDHATDCVKDMLASAKFYGFDQPQIVNYNPVATLEVEQA